METPMTLPETIRSQLDSGWIGHTGNVCPVEPTRRVTVQAAGYTATGPAMSFYWGEHPTFRVSRYKLAEVVVEHAGGTVTLTPEQARKVLAGGELVVQMGKVVVK